jgi:hypothetical protein
MIAIGRLRPQLDHLLDHSPVRLARLGTIR